MTAPHADQLALDLEEANERLAAMADAIAAKDDLEQQMLALQRQLKEVKRRLKEAQWNLGVCVSRERGRARQRRAGG